MPKKNYRSSKLPVVIASSVIRSTHQGESHGGIYLVDLEHGRHTQLLDWDDQGISWAGRGLDRGLRGITFHAGKVYLAASNEIFVYDHRLNLVETLTNPYMQHVHEICVHDDILAITSTGYDSILFYDLGQKKFSKGFLLRAQSDRDLLFDVYDPLSELGPSQEDTIHINSISYGRGAFHFSCLALPHLFRLDNDQVSAAGDISAGTHNAQSYQQGILFNDTGQNCTVLLDDCGKVQQIFPVVHYNPQHLLHNNLPEDHARQGFARGLCHQDDLVIIGSSPATITVYQVGRKMPVTSVNLTMDVRNAIHGLEIWPFPV